MPYAAFPAAMTRKSRSLPRSYFCSPLCKTPWVHCTHREMDSETSNSSSARRKMRRAICLPSFMDAICTARLSAGLDRFWVQHVGRALTLKKCDRILRRYKRHLGPCLCGRGAKVRGQHDIGTFQSRVHEGFLLKNIKSCSCNLL